MNVRLYIDPELGYPHIYTHGVDEDEVEDVIMEWMKTSPEVELAYRKGQTRGGRYLLVVYVRDPEPDSVFVITAYELTGKPLTAHRRRMRRRRR